MTVDWQNVDTWFGAFSAPCAKKRVRGLVYPFVCVCVCVSVCVCVCVCAKARGLVSTVFAASKEGRQNVVLRTVK